MSMRPAREVVCGSDEELEGAVRQLARAASEIQGAVTRLEAVRLENEGAAPDSAPWAEHAARAAAVGDSREPKVRSAADAVDVCRVRFCLSGMCYDLLLCAGEEATGEVWTRQSLIGCCSIATTRRKGLRNGGGWTEEVGALVDAPLSKAIKCMCNQ